MNFHKKYTCQGVKRNIIYPFYLIVGSDINKKRNIIGNNTNNNLKERKNIIIMRIDIINKTK